MPTPVSAARQCLTVESAHALDEAVNVARRRSHSQTTSLHAVSAFLSLPTSVLREACARARNSAYSPRLQFKALELCLGVSLDRIQSGQPAAGSDDPPISNSLMAAIKRSQAHQRRLPETFRLYHEQNQNSVSCVKVELRQLILSILDDPVVSRVFGEAGFRSSELKLSIIRPIPNVLRYPRPRGPPMFLYMAENPDPGTGLGLYPVRRGFGYPYRNSAGYFHKDDSYQRIGAVFGREKGRNPVLIGVSAYGALIDFVYSLEKRIDGILPKELTGLNLINIGGEISNHISDKFDKTYTNKRFNELGWLVEESSGPGLVVNFGDLRVFTDGNEGGNGGSADYIVGQLSELLRRYGRRIWLMGAAASDEVYYKFVRRFPSVEKDWDLQVLTITSLGPCLAEKSYTKSSLMESFVPFGGFFSSPTELKLHFPGSVNFPVHKPDQNDELTGLPVTRPVSSVSDHHQSSLPSWLRMIKPAGLGQGFGSTCRPKKLFDSGGGLRSSSSFSGSAGSAKSATTDLGLGIPSFSTRTDLNRSLDENMIEMRHSVDCSGSQSSSASCPQDHSNDINAETFKIIFRTLTEKVPWQEEAARVISCVISQQKNENNTRRDLWFNLVGSDAISNRRIAVAVAEVIYPSENRFMAFDLGGSLEINGRDDYLVRLRGKTIVDYIFDGLCRNPFCVIFFENLEKADEQLQRSLSMAIQTGKFLDSHGREVRIGNTTFMATTLSSGTIESSVYYSEDKIMRAKDRKMEILIEISSGFPFSRSFSSSSSVNKKRLIGLDKIQDKNETTGTIKRSNRSTVGILDLNLPAQESEIEDSEDNYSIENSEIWLKNFMNHARFIRVPMKPFDSDGLAERIEKRIKETFKKCVCSDCSCLIEIDPRIMTRLLAAVYFSDANRLFEDWLKKTLTRAFVEVQERYKITSSSIVRLVGRDRCIVEEEQTQEDGLLPCRIAFS